MLLLHGGDLTSKDVNGLTACQIYYHSCVLPSSAKATLKESGTTVQVSSIVDSVVQRDYSRLTYLLSEAKSLESINVVDSVTGYSALHTAAAKGLWYMLPSIIEARCSLETHDIDGETALAKGDHTF